MTLECPKCGMLNSDEMLVCGNCGTSLAGVRQKEPKPSVLVSKPLNLGTGEADTEHSDEGTREQMLEAQIAIAINVRRIFLLALLSIVVWLISWTIGLWANHATIDPEDLDNVVTGSALLLILVVGVGLYYIISVKRVTKMD